MRDGEQRYAFVTGASRGIGAAAAVKLAEAGFDVAVTARTTTEQDRPAAGLSAGAVAPRAGSLADTEIAVAAVGRRAVPIRMDLTDRSSVVAAADQALAEFGKIDVVVNNGIYQGPGNMAPLLGTPIDLIETTLQADVLSVTALLQRLLPGMIDQGGGTIVNVTSAVAFRDPPGPLGKGGWGFAYGVAKGACDRMAGLLNAELGDRGIVAYNIEPGFVAYGEHLAQAKAGFPDIEVTPPEAIGAAIAWLATSADALRFRNKRVHGPELCRDLHLLPGWHD